MNDFEFQRFTAFGQYRPTGSLVHRLDPRTRLLGAILLVGAATLTQSAMGLVIGMAAVLCAFVPARLPPGRALRGLLPPLPILLLLAFIQILFGFHDETPPLLLEAGPVRISAGDLRMAAILLLRFALLMLSMTLFSSTTSTGELIHGLDTLLRPLGRLGLPTHDFVTVVQVTLRFVPLLLQEAERIAKAQASRGAEWGTGKGGLLARARRTLPILIPLFLTGLHRAERMAMAMDARGYSSITQRTSMVELEMQRRDAVALALVAGVALLIVWG